MQEKKDLTFSSLVRKIDEKWGHTYLEPEEVEEEDFVLEDLLIKEWLAIKETK